MKPNLISSLQKAITCGLILVLAILGTVSTSTASGAAVTTTTATLSWPQNYQGMWYNKDQIGLDGSVLKLMLTSNTIHVWELCWGVYPLCDLGTANLVMADAGVATADYITSWGSVSLHVRIIILDYRTLTITTWFPWGYPNTFTNNFYRTTSG